MAIAVPATDLAREKVPAVVHANGTARVQTLAPEDNPFLADVLDRFAAFTGVPVLINTSLNVKGTPIGGTPQMAIDCLASSGLDGLMLDGGWWVSQVRIGYSFWGFLGPGITDTPDGGRSHRRPLIDGLIAVGHEIVFLQRNRDLHEAGCDLRHLYAWDDGLPAIDALFLEWRWPIPGRSTTAVRQPRARLRPAPPRRTRRPLHRPARGADHRVGQGPATRTWLTAAAHAERDRLRGGPAARAWRGEPAVPRLRQRPGRGRPRRPWRCCPGHSRSPTPGTSTTATRRSPSSSRPPPSVPAPGGREMDPHRGLAARELHRPLRVPRSP